MFRPIEASAKTASAMAADAGRVELLAALHWNIHPPFAQGNRQLSAQVHVLGRCIAAQIGMIVPRARGERVDLVLVSTVISGAFSGSAATAQQLFDVIESRCGMRPVALLHTYMCAGWGYALRWFSRHTDARRVMICIVDVDVHDLDYHRHHRQIGKLGFGITSILLYLANDRTITAVTGGPYAESAFKEFMRALKIHNMRHKPSLTFIPFFGPGLGEIAEKILGRENLGANRHEVYGHCFGSDPWIGIIEWVEANPLRYAVNVTAGAVALSGYFTLCDVAIVPQTLIGMRFVGGEEADLEEAIVAPSRLHDAAEPAVWEPA